MRLAGVLLDEGAYDDAARQVSTTVAADLSPPFQASFADRRGRHPPRAEQARRREREYADALKSLESRPDGRGYANVVQLKLDGLMGGVATAPVASAAMPPPTPAPAAAAATTGAKP